MQVKINKVKQNLKQSKGCACEKLPLQRSSFSSPAMAPEKTWCLVDVGAYYSSIPRNGARKDLMAGV
jgi:hypothetical protein